MQLFENARFSPKRSYINHYQSSTSITVNTRNQTFTGPLDEPNIESNQSKKLTMSTYKLTYFNVKARAELSRWIFAVANQKYDDVRIEGADWKDLKPKTPFSQVPILEVDGIILAQSYTIARFLAKRFNLVGKNDIEEALVNMVMDCTSDMWETFVQTIRGSDQAKKDAAKKLWNEEQKDQFLAKFEKLLSSNNGGDGYYVGSGLTVADLAAAYILGIAGDIDKTKYGKIKSLKSRVEAIPELAKWIETRPVTKL